MSRKIAHKPERLCIHSLSSPYLSSECELIRVTGIVTEKTAFVTQVLFLVPLHYLEYTGLSASCRSAETVLTVHGFAQLSPPVWKPFLFLCTPQDVTGTDHFFPEDAFIHTFHNI